MTRLKICATILIFMIAGNYSSAMSFSEKLNALLSGKFKNRVEQLININKEMDQIIQKGITEDGSVKKEGGITLDDLQKQSQLSQRFIAEMNKLKNDLASELNIDIKDKENNKKIVCTIMGLIDASAPIFIENCK